MKLSATLLLCVALATGCGREGDGASEEWTSQRPEFERIAAELFADPLASLSRTAAPGMRARLEDPALGADERFELELQLAERLMLDGALEESIELHRALLERVPAGSPKAAQITRALGFVYLRQAETLNCVGLHNAECCIFPLQGGGLHARPEPARQARRCFEEFLLTKPDNLRARWLLNVAAMALGEYPHGLPPEQLVGLERFASEHDVGRFEDVAERLGLDRLNLAGGVAVEDFDGDGTLDILVSTYDPLGPLSLHANRGARGFEDVSTAARVDDQLGGLNLLAADYDDDGDVDVFVMRGAWLTSQGKIRRSLLENEGGRFRDVTRRARLYDDPRPSQAAAFGDLDGDGDLDLLVGNESDLAKNPPQDHPSQLYRNEGDRTFAEVAAEAGVENDRYCKGVALGDYDNDGDLDAYLSNFGPNRLYQNDGRMRFTDVARELGVEEPVRRSFATWFFDADNDGWLDLWVAAFEGGIAELAADALDLPRERYPPRLYRNLGGSFEDATERLGLARFFLPMGSNFGDVDNDGWLDLYLGTGDPLIESIMPNVMLRNDGGQRFQDVTLASGTGHLQKGHGVAFADLDQDGDQDLFHQLGGFFGSDRFHNALFRNPGHGHHWLHLELRGTQSNSRGIGARIRVVLATPAGPRELHRAVGSVSSFGGSPLRQELGLGDATKIERLEIRWPAPGSRSVFTDVPLDRLLLVTEGESELVELPHAPFSW